MSEEKRIYVVVAETVDTPNGRITQPCGRAMAQATHARAKMEITSRIYQQRESERRIGIEDMAFVENTAIMLAARDSKELEHVYNLLAQRGIMRFPFFDRNEPVYGMAEHVAEAAQIMTAIATVPTEPSKVLFTLDYLPLWDCKCA